MAKGVRQGRGRSGKGVKDHKRGSAANGYDVAVDGEDGEGHNSKHFEASGRTLNDYLDVVDEADEAVRAIMEDARKKCQPHRTSLKNARKRMVDDGYHSTELDTVVRKHRLKRKVDAVTNKLNDEQILFFASLEKALGEFRNTPLGSAAVQAAEAAMH
jgi:hypothetical protein